MRRDALRSMSIVWCPGRGRREVLRRSRALRSGAGRRSRRRTSRRPRPGHHTMDMERRASRRMPCRSGGQRGCRGHRTGSASRIVSRALTTTTGSKVRTSTTKWAQRDMPADRLGMRQYHALLCGSRLHGDGDRADAGLRLTRGRSRRLGARADTTMRRSNSLLGIEATRQLGRADEAQMKGAPAQRTFDLGRRFTEEATW